MAQNRRPGLEAGFLFDLLAQHIGHSAQPHRIGACRIEAFDRHLPADGPGAFGNDDDAESLSAVAAFHDHPADFVQIVWNLRQQQHVAAAGHSGMQRQPSGIASHRLDDHHPVVRHRRGVQPVDGFGDDLHRGVEAEGVIGFADVIIDGFRHSNGAQAFFRQFAGDGQRAVAANGHQRLNAQFAAALDAAVADIDRLFVFLFSRKEAKRIVAIGCAQDRAAFGQDSGHIGILEQSPAILGQPKIAVLESDDFHAVARHGRLGHSANDGVEAGAVAPAGQNADSPFAHARVLSAAIEFPR
ncbi:MAG: hypothetical protein BWZ10_01892 [candidate division BRC1 bacterium ADurb.BinA364]|nr:MAG: hypothetical protein BWZ10_01892 [candidate division BRC1 bacterium ADurb.BinA364]